MTRLPIFRATLLIALALAILPVPGTGQLSLAQLRLPPLPSPPSAAAQRPVQRITTPPSPVASTTTFTPRFEVIAETRLLMEGLLHANYLGLQRLLKKQPPDRDTWVFARGQAILIAEGGNLLLLRPARGTGRDPWMKQAMEMRTRATTLARAIAAKDYNKSVQALANLSTSCKSCHQTFRVPAKIDPPPEVEPKAPLPPETDTE